jgi:hypothetical protein
MADLFEPIEELVSDVVEPLADDIIKPRPGGFMDRWEKEKAEKAAAADRAKNEAEPIQQAAYKSVKVAQEQPEIFAITTVSISAGGVQMLLPNSPYRYRATIVSTATVTLAKDQGAALGGVGFPLPANTPIVLNARAQLWGFAAGAAVVSVISELYAPEK